MVFFVFLDFRNVSTLWYFLFFILLLIISGWIYI